MLLVAEKVGEAEIVVSRLNTRSNIEVAKLQMFSREIGKVLGFLTAYRLYIKMKMRDASIKEQM